VKLTASPIWLISPSANTAAEAIQEPQLSFSDMYAQACLRALEREKGRHQ
jgi:hypothetical protein